MKAFIIIFTLSLVGCATNQSYIDKTNQNVGSFQGHNIQEVVNQIGYYSRSFQSPDGKTVYAWETSRSAVLPQVNQNVNNSSGFVSGNQAYVTGTSQSYQMGGIPITRWCNAYFKVDENQTVIDWQWQGNGC